MLRLIAGTALATTIASRRVAARVFAADAAAPNLLENGTFGFRTVAPWALVIGQAKVLSHLPDVDMPGVALGPAQTSIEQEITVLPRSCYVLSARTQGGGGSELVRLGVRTQSGRIHETASASLKMKRAEVAFRTGDKETNITVFLAKQGGDAAVHAGDIEVRYVGRAFDFNHSILALLGRTPKLD